MYILKAKDIEIKLDIRIFEEDLEFPTNTILTVQLQSFGFSSVADMDVDIKELAVFAKDLLNIYNSLEGAANLREPYGYKSHIEFSALNRGHIGVSGTLHAQPGALSHILSFENFIDQTELEDFAKRLFEDHKKYL